MTERCMAGARVGLQVHVHEMDPLVATSSMATQVSSLPRHLCQRSGQGAHAARDGSSRAPAASVQPEHLAGTAVALAVGTEQLQ